jgi:Helicase associated domain
MRQLMKQDDIDLEGSIVHYFIWRVSNLTKEQDELESTDGNNTKIIDPQTRVMSHLIKTSLLSKYNKVITVLKNELDYITLLQDVVDSYESKGIEPEIYSRWRKCKPRTDSNLKELDEFFDTEDGLNTVNNCDEDDNNIINKSPKTKPRIQNVTSPEKYIDNNFENESNNSNNNNDVAKPPPSKKRRYYNIQKSVNGVDSEVDTNKAESMDDSDCNSINDFSNMRTKSNIPNVATKRQSDSPLTVDESTLEEKVKTSIVEWGKNTSLPKGKTPTTSRTSEDLDDNFLDSLAEWQKGVSHIKPVLPATKNNHTKILTHAIRNAKTPIWDEYYKQLALFRKKSGHCAPKSNTQLSKWVQYQRKLYKRMSPTLTPERIQKLDDLDMQWTVVVHVPLEKRVLNYLQLDESSLQNIGTNNINNTIDIERLVQWIQDTVKYYKNRLKPLENCNKSDYENTRFAEHITELVLVKKRGYIINDRDNILAALPNNNSLVTWVNSIRRQYKIMSKYLTEDRKMLLEEIGFDFVPKLYYDPPRNNNNKSVILHDVMKESNNGTI